MGVIESRIEYAVAGRWKRSVYTLQGLLEDALLDWPMLTYRYREGRRAVMLWPESRMGEVQEL